MAYTKEKKDECFDYIISEIESGKSLRYALDTNGMPSSKTFYEWLEEKDDKGILTKEAEEKVKRYAHACEIRELKLLDEILLIADDQEDDIIKTEDGRELTNHNVIQRSKVRIEARQWLLGKLNPPKYGVQKTHTEHSGEITTNVISLGSGIKPNETTS